MKFTNIVEQLYTQPWLIRPEVHQCLRTLLEGRILANDMESPNGGLKELMRLEGAALKSTPNGNAYNQYASSEYNTENRIQSGAPLVQVYSDTAVIPFQGVVARNCSLFWQSCGFCSMEQFRADITRARNDRQIDKIIIDCDSPGGQAAGTPEGADLTYQASKDKMVFGWVEGQSCSAAYYVLSQAGEGIFSTQSAVLGSIGTYLALLDSSVAYSQAGFKREVIKAGKYKAMGEPGTSLSEEQKSFLQQSVERTNERFKAAVKRGRGDVDDDIMQGQWYDGIECTGHNLIDGIKPDFQTFLNEIVNL